MQRLYRRPDAKRSPRTALGKALGKALGVRLRLLGAPRYFFILSLPFSDRRARLSLERDWHRLAARHLTCRVLPVFPFPWTTPRPNVTAAAPRCLPVKSPQQRPCPAGPEASAVRSAIPVPSAVTFRESKPASTGWVFPGLCWHRRHENPRD